METEKNETIVPSGESHSEHLINKSRRAVTKFGIASPVLMTLINRPAWGGSSQLKCQVSGFSSIAVKGNNLSGTNNITSCGFIKCKPQHWKDNCGYTKNSRGGYVWDDKKDLWPKGCFAILDDTRKYNNKKCYTVNHYKRPSWNPVLNTQNLIPEDSIETSSRKCFVKTAFGSGSDNRSLNYHLNNSLSSDESLCIAALLSAKKKADGTNVADYGDFPLTEDDCKRIYNTIFGVGSTRFGTWSATDCRNYLNLLLG